MASRRQVTDVEDAISLLSCAALRCEHLIGTKLRTATGLQAIASKIYDLTSELQREYFALQRGASSRCPICGGCHPGRCPTPKEIVERCSKIRGRWTAIDERARTVQPARGWAVPEASLRQDEGDET